jgi:hypothetical protein
VIYFAKGTPPYSTVEFKVIEVDLSIEVNGLRETATHRVQEKMAVRDEGRKYNGFKYSFLGLVPIGQTEPLDDLEPCLVSIRFPSSSSASPKTISTVVFIENESDMRICHEIVKTKGQSG